jgi:hypothetical protein
VSTMSATATATAEAAGAARIARVHPSGPA